MISLIELLKEANRHPLYGLFLGAVLGTWIHFSLQTFTPRAELAQQAADIREAQQEQAERIGAVAARMAELSAQVRRAAIEQKIQGIEMMIDQTERAISEGPARRIDQRQLARLRAELSAAKRELERVE